MSWPELRYAQWAPTGEALHLWSQIVGKVRLSSSPWLNHSWHATYYVTPRGLTTGPIHQDKVCFSLDFDFHDHRLLIDASNGFQGGFDLSAMSVAAFHSNVRDLVEGAGGTFNIHGQPNEVPNPVPFEEDTSERDYQPYVASSAHTALFNASRVFECFRTSYLGKCSPVHLFWGAFDLAVTRFSGRPAPEHPGGIPNLPDTVTREAYSHEVASAGFWFGGNGAEEAMFYAYAYPTPEAFKSQPVQPKAAYWDDSLGEFLLPYEAVRTAPDPDEALMAFLQTTYAAAADTAAWDRASLECAVGAPGVAPWPRSKFAPAQ